MNRRWELDGAFVNMNGRIVKVISYDPCLLEDQRTGEVFKAKSYFDAYAHSESFSEMEIIALMASDEPIQL